MDITYNFVSFIDALGVIQGLLFGTMLLFLHSKQSKPTLYLGLFILLFSLEPIPNILQDLGVLSHYPKWELFPVSFHFLAYPLLYLYIQKVSILEDKKPSYWTLIPGLLEFIAALIVFFLPVETKLQIKASSFATLYFFSGLCYSIYISILILKWIRIHSKELENQYTSIEHKTLNWTKWFIYASIGFHVLLLLNFFADNYYWYVMATIVNILLIYWVSIRGITQESVYALVWLENKNNPKSLLIEQQARKKTSEILNPNNKLPQDFIPEEDAKEILETVEDYIQNSKCYINDKLTIIDLAEATNIHPKRISHAINSVKGINFNNYINAFRVAYAKELLKDDAAQNLSVEGIGTEAGFHSKTTFYSAFRKIEGMTPAQYKSS